MLTALLFIHGDPDRQPDVYAQPLFGRGGAIQFGAPSTGSSQETAGGASLKTDPELERLLKRAEEFAATGRYDLAVVLWQKALDDSGDTVMTREDWTFRTFEHEYRKYRAVSVEIERTLAKLPARGLAVYRLRADGEAKGLLTAGQGAGRERALAEVVRRFFLSSHGDEAAFELACRKLDRHEFVGASQLLSKLRDNYPDSNLPRSQILLRLAVANARIGDPRAARAVLAELKQLSPPESVARVVLVIERELTRAGSVAIPSQIADDEWRMALGRPSRNGHMKRLPVSATSATLSEQWSRKFDLKQAFSSNVSVGRTYLSSPFSGPGRIQRVPNTVAANNRSQLMSRWKEAGWMPTGQMLFDDGRVLFKTNDRLVCCDAETGEIDWMNGWRIQYQLDPLSKLFASRPNPGIAGSRPKSAIEVQLFGDRVHQSMSIIGDLVFSIEGPRVDTLSGQLFDQDMAETTTPTTARSRIYQSGMPRRTRRNWLNVYDVKYGKFKWRRAAGEDKQASKFQMGFLAAPVPYAGLLLAPITDNGELWLLAMKGGIGEDAGQTVWKTYLCDEPEGGCSPWSPVGVAVDGGDAYVATGAGAVFAVDAISGSVRWVVRYQRSGKPNTTLARYYGSQFGAVLDLSGWDDDVVIPHGKQLVVMASDNDQLFALDRRTGDFLWDSPRKPSDEDAAAQYCLGVVNDELYVAGRKVVRRYNIPSGRLLWQWEPQSGESFGRGALTDDAIYLPVKDSIVRLELEKGREQYQVGVVSPAREYVGNLFSDGKRLLAVGLGRVYALTDLERRYKNLALKIKQGDGRAQFERMRLKHRQGHAEDAISDLRGGFGLLRKSQGPVAAHRALYDGIGELALAESRPSLTLELLALTNERVKSASAEDEQVLKTLSSLRSDLLETLLRTVEQKETKGVASAVLAIAPLCEERSQFSAASRALAATVRTTDADMLKTAIGHKDPRIRQVAIAGLTPALGKDAVPLLKRRLEDDVEQVRLVAAVALINKGNREPLAVLGELLKSSEFNIRSPSAQILQYVTGEQIPFAAYEKPEVSAKAATQWQKWIAANGATAKLRYPIRETDILLEKTLIVNRSRNQVIEIDSSGKTTWTKTLQGCVACQGLPNGHRLLATYKDKYVAEYDENGEEVWRKRMPGKPFSVQRLSNGNTLVTCYDVGKILEIRPDAENPVWEINLSGNPMDARRLENGNTLICLSATSRVVEVDRSGRVVKGKDLRNMSSPRSAQRLENGNTLVCQTGSGRVVEVDPNGNEIVFKSGLSSPLEAQRLPNGNTLIVDSRGVYEFDRNGKEVWKRLGSGFSSACRF